jgi:PAS domain S-box-containing protein
LNFQTALSWGLLAAAIIFFNLPVQAAATNNVAPVKHVSPPPASWESHQQILIVIAIVVLVVQSLSIVALLYQRRYKDQTETELFNSQQMLRTVLDTIPQRVFWKDRNSIFLGCNQPLAKDCGFSSPEEIIGKSDYETVATSQADRYRADDREVMESNRPKLNYEEPQNQKNGSSNWLRTNKVPLHDQKGRVIGVLGTYEDITERKRAAETITYERQLLRALLDLLPEGVYIKDLNSCFLMANETLAKRFGKDSPNQLLGLSDKDFFPPEVAAVFLADELKVFAGETINEKEEIVIFPTGKKRTLMTTKVPFRNSQGKICGLVGTGRDVTEHKLLEEQFRQSQKMEAFGQLAGGVAHDFNNLLTVIEGHVVLLQLRESTPAEQANSLSEIAKASERAANLTRQLLTFSRRQLFQPKPVDLNEIVANTTKMLQRLIGEHIGLETHFAPGGAPVKADRNMMEQILINLAVNSRDAMPKGGRLIIQTVTETLDKTAVAANPKARAGDFIRLSVTDTGCGIAPEQMEHIFEPFFTTKEVGKGTGLGLATVFGIVTQHHGWIEVKSKTNQGTTFQIYLSRLDQTESARSELSRPPDVRGGSETILLVEDEAPVRSLARTLLERKGYRIIEADSGLSALEIWQHQRDQIDLLFTDMVMPEGISGRELAAQLQAEKPGLKVIYSSGYTDDMLGKGSPLRNNPNFLEKPFNSHIMLKRVRDCLDGVSGH